MSFERIRKIENELETGQVSTRGRSIIHDIKKPRVPEDWDDYVSETDPQNTESEPDEIVKTNWFKRIFIVSILFALFGGGIFGFSQFFNPQDSLDKNVVVTVTSRPSVDGGESFPVTVVVTNKNKVPLEYVKISLEYPLVTGGELNGLFQEKTLDSIGPGEIKELPFGVTLYGSSNTTRKISARVSYRVPGSLALFESISDTETVLRSSPVRLAMDVPTDITPNQEIALTIRYASNLKTASPSSMVRIDYPTGFIFTSAEPKPDIGNNIWKVGTLVPGSENIIIIKGSMNGVLGQERVFTSSIGSILENQNDFESVYATTVSSSKIKQSFLAILLQPTGGILSGDKYVVNSGAETDINLRWINTENTPLTNVQIKAVLSGNIFNPDKLRVGNGFYDSNTNTITWTAAQVPQLARIAPGADGSVDFGLSDLSVVSSQEKIINDPLLTATVSVSGFSSEGKKLELSNIAKQSITLSTDAHLVAGVTTSKGPIKNTGPVPPKAGTETTYTINWKLTNALNTVDQASVSAVLPQWVRYTGVVSPQSAQQFVSYNQTTRTVTWSPGSVAAGSGYSIDPVQVYFQVALKPSSSQVSQTPELVGGAVFTARDQKLGLPIRVSGKTLTTASNSDGGGSVIK